MKKIIFALTTLSALAFAGCSQDDSSVNMQADVINMQTPNSIKAKSGGGVICNSFTINEFQVDISIFTVPVQIGNPIKVYVCCGPPFYQYGGCAPVPKRLYDSYVGTKEVSNPTIGTPIGEIINDPTINLKDVRSVFVKEASVESGLTIAPKEYIVDADGYVYFEQVEVR